MQENLKLAKRLNVLAGVVTVVVLLLVGMMRRPEFKIPTDIDFSFLPPFHATLNALVAVVLLFALYFIKNKNIEAHRKSIYLAMALSAMFLLSYVVYHFTTEETKYCFEGASKNIYFFFLIYTCCFGWSDAAIYFVDLSLEPTRIKLKNIKGWPGGCFPFGFTWL